jgi:hypothetical protein
MAKSAATKKPRWPNNLTSIERLESAKLRINNLLDHTLFSLSVRESNAQLMSARFRRQIPISHAANCYNTLLVSQLRYEIVCISAIWDGIGSGKSDNNRNSIPSLIELISDPSVENEIVRVAESGYDDDGQDQTISGYNARRRREEKARALQQLAEVKKLAALFPKNQRFRKLIAYRDQIVAHTLTIQGSDVVPGAIPKTRGFWDYTIKCVGLLNLLIAGSGFDFSGSEEMHRRNAKQFWDSMNFKSI